jgi:membrane protease YdiL (CAAX protease family)
MEIGDREWTGKDRRRLLLRSTLILCPLIVFWIALMPLHGLVFTQHEDWLDACYLFMQITPVYTGFVFLACIGMHLWYGRKVTARELGIAGFDAWWLVWVVLLGIGLIFCDVLWEFVLGQIGIPVTSRASLVTNYLHLPLALGMMIFLLCAVAPVCEEVLFRGLIFQWLSRRLPLLAALALSAAIFAGMHLAFALTWDSGVVPYFLTGLACGWLYFESRSILPSILLHSSLNVVFVVITLLK